jgi:hypothetical protein
VSDKIVAVIMTAVLAALIVSAMLFAFWVGFFAVAGAEEPSGNRACGPGFIIGVGTLTADSTGEGFAVGNGLFLMPRPETPAEIRLRELLDTPVEVVIRVAK